MLLNYAGFRIHCWLVRLCAAEAGSVLGSGSGLEEIHEAQYLYGAAASSRAVTGRQYLVRTTPEWPCEYIPTSQTGKSKLCYISNRQMLFSLAPPHVSWPTGSIHGRPLGFGFCQYLRTLRNGERREGHHCKMSWSKTSTTPLLRGSNHPLLC